MATALPDPPARLSAGPADPSQPGPTDQPQGDLSQDASPAPGNQDPKATETLANILEIIAAARRLGRNFPAAAPQIQQIMTSVRELQMTIMQTQQPPQVAAPPQ